MRRLIRALRRSHRGATAIEFAIICPVLLLLIMGLGELAFQAYLQAALTGAIQKAARDSTIEGNNTASANTTIDNNVMVSVNTVIKNATWDTPIRESYAHFADIGPEYYWDNNPANGKYDASTECFLDANGNGVWDADPGASGQGGADAAVVYQMGFTYPRLFPLYKMLGWPSTVHIVAKTIMKNQPYKYQNTPDDTLICPKGGKTS
jgi:Flp pilus assembly protein TadG